MASANEQTRDEAGLRIDLPPPFAFAVGERVAGPGFSGEVIDRPGPYSVTVVQNGVRLTASVTCLRKA